MLIVNTQLAKIPYFDLRCKYCGSRNLIKYGRFRGIQRLFCKDCQRKFADNSALPKGQTPVTQIGSAVGMYYEGQSLNSICRLLTQIYGSYPSDSTVYRWVTRFTDQALQETKGLKPSVGDKWIADETVLHIGGKNIWFWDIIDEKTRFLLASHMSRTRTTRDAQKLMELAAKCAGKNPKVVVTDKLAVYLDGVELTFGSDTKHIATKPFTVEQNTNLIERFHGTLKDRTKVMRGLKDLPTARLITSGWLLHYNYIRPHESLGKTPAQAAGIKFPYSNWKDLVSRDVPSSVASNPKSTDLSSFDDSRFSRIERGNVEPSYTASGFKIARRIGKHPKVGKQKRRIPPTPTASIVRL
jgi:putative transposase